MKANELTVGCFVLYGGSISEITCIESQECSCKLRPIGDIHFNNVVKKSLGNIFPIPLTEEWLLKFGFEHKFDNIYTYPFRISDNLVVEMKFEGWPENISLFTNGFFSSNSARYVHQLQNLYFALTGEELTIQELANQ